MRERSGAEGPEEDCLGFSYAERDTKVLLVTTMQRVITEHLI